MKTHSIYLDTAVKRHCLYAVRSSTYDWCSKAQSVHPWWKLQVHGWPGLYYRCLKCGADKWLNSEVAE